MFGVTWLIWEMSGCGIPCACGDQSGGERGPIPTDVDGGPEADRVEAFPLGPDWAGDFDCGEIDGRLELSLTEEDDGVSRGSGFLTVADRAVLFAATVTLVDEPPDTFGELEHLRVDVLADDCVDDLGESAACPLFEAVVWQPLEERLEAELVRFEGLPPRCRVVVRPDGPVDTAR